MGYSHHLGCQLSANYGRDAYTKWLLCAMLVAVLFKEPWTDQIELLFSGVDDATTAQFSHGQGDAHIYSSTGLPVVKHQHFFFS